MSPPKNGIAAAECSGVKPDARQERSRRIGPPVFKCMKPPADHRMEVGLLAGTHGLRGDLKLRPLPTGEYALRAGLEVLLEDETGALTSHQLTRCTPHKQFLLVRFDGIHDLESARPLVGQRVLVRCAQLPDLDEGHYFWSELEGLGVIDQRRGLLGRVEEMFTTPAHDILVIRGVHGEVLIPAIPPFVVQFQPEKGQLLVDLPDGLVPGDHEI